MQLYQKIPFGLISYTEQDRLELESIFIKRNPQGSGKVVDLNELNSSYCNRLLNTLPIDHIAVLHCTTPNIVMSGKTLKSIHTDPRAVGLNIPISNCDSSAYTVFYDEDTLVPIVAGTTGEYKPTMYKEKESGAIELDRFFLDMNSAVLLRTNVPHAKLQTHSIRRMFLSVTPTVGFDDFIKLVAGEGFEPPSSRL